MKALILDAEHKTAHVLEVPQPKPAPEEILVRVHAVALNPIDPLYVFNPLGQSGRTVGSDFAGTIVAIGDDASRRSEWAVGDRVAGFLQGACSANDRPGAFAEYLVVPWDLVWRVPDHFKLEEAASVSLCALTAAQALFDRLRLPSPFPPPQDQFQPTPDTTNILTYGASTSVGLWAAQLIHHSAKVSGKQVRLFGTASKARFPLLQQAPYSYDHLVEYRDSSWAEKIGELTNGEGIHFAYDCISEHDSVATVHGTLAPGGKQAIVRSRAAAAWQAGPLEPEPIYGAVWEGLGVDIQYAFFLVPASARAREFAVAFYKWLSEGGGLIPNPIRVMPGGLDRIVQDGFSLLGPGTMNQRKADRHEEFMRPVSAEKLVYLIRE
jgi:NADPH:quinone reductase-like Zn-dependent oxidoreductase